MELAIVLLVTMGPAPNADEAPVQEVVGLINVPHNPHVVGTSLHEGGVVEQGTVVSTSRMGWWRCRVRSS